MQKSHLASVVLVGLMVLAGCSSSEDQTATNQTNSDGVVADDASGDDTADDDIVEGDSDVAERQTDENADGSTQAEGAGPPQAQAGNAEEGFDETITSASDLRETTPVALQRYEADGTELTLFFEMETQHCFGLEVNHTESDSEVEIDIQTGLLPGVNADDCGIGVYSYNTIIELDEPLNGRSVVALNPPSRSGAAQGSDEPDNEELEVPVDDDGRPNSDQFLDLTIDEAIDLAEGSGHAWHVARLDGEPSIATPPREPHIVFEIEDDVVVEARLS